MWIVWLFIYKYTIFCCWFYEVLYIKASLIYTLSIMWFTSENSSSLPIFFVYISLKTSFRLCSLNAHLNRLSTFSVTSIISEKKDNIIKLAFEEFCCFHCSCNRHYNVVQCNICNWHWVIVTSYNSFRLYIEGIAALNYNIFKTENCEIDRNFSVFLCRFCAIWRALETLAFISSRHKLEYKPWTSAATK